jgi:hypothetical protein
LAAREVDILAFEHHGYLRGSEAKNFLIRAIEKTEEDKKFILEKVRDQKDFEEVAQKLADDFRDQTRLPFLPPEIRKSVAETVVRKILQGGAE